MLKNILTVTIGLTVASLLLLLGCAKPNMQINSGWYDGADITPERKIFLRAGHPSIGIEPTNRESSAMPKVRSLFEERGFEFVDSIADAKLILNLHIYENSPFYCRGHLWSAAQWVLPLGRSGNGKQFWRRGMNSGGVITDEIDGYDALVLRLKFLIQNGEPPIVVWNSSVRTKSEFLESDIDKMIDIAVAQYGKNTSEYIVYVPEKQPDKTAAR